MRCVVAMHCSKYVVEEVANFIPVTKARRCMMRALSADSSWKPRCFANIKFINKLAKHGVKVHINTDCVVVSVVPNSMKLSHWFIYILF